MLRPGAGLSGVPGDSCRGTGRRRAGVRAVPGAARCPPRARQGTGVGAPERRAAGCGQKARDGPLPGLPVAQGHQVAVDRQGAGFQAAQAGGRRCEEQRAQGVARFPRRNGDALCAGSGPRPRQGPIHAGPAAADAGAGGRAVEPGQRHLVAVDGFGFGLDRHREGRLPAVAVPAACSGQAVGAGGHEPAGAAPSAGARGRSWQAAGHRPVRLPADSRGQRGRLKQLGGADGGKQPGHAAVGLFRVREPLAAARATARRRARRVSPAAQPTARGSGGAGRGACRGAGGSACALTAKDS